MPLVAFHYDFSHSNPYQGLIYSEWNGAAVSMPLRRASLARRLGLLDWLHLHWDEHVFPSRNRAETERQIGHLKDFTGAGGRLMYTVHNYAPHETTAEDLPLFERTRQYLIDIADVIHVHSRYAGAHVRDRYGADPARLLCVQHPSYGGAYGPPLSHRPDSGRCRLLCFGQMRPYKGLDTLFEGLRGIGAQHDRIEVHLAGRGSGRWAAAAGETVTVRISDGFIPDDAVAGLFAEADFVVFTFDRQLTSGSFMLAFTFGVPPIFPRLPSLLEVTPPELQVLSYEPGNADDLGRVILHACAMSDAERRALGRRCTELAEVHAPEHASRALWQAVSDPDGAALRLGMAG